MRLSRIVVAAAIILTGCSTLIGVNDLYLDPAGGGGGGDGGSPDGMVAADAGSDGSSDASTCAADLNISKQNCGRCGHDCLGGDCRGGQCQAVSLLNAQPGPLDFALDATYAYVANNNNGSIVRIERSGTGTAKTIATGLGDSLLGIAVSGTTLFWSSDTALDDASIAGGVYMCGLPDCTTKKRISTTGSTRHMAVKDGYLYFAADNGVRRVKVDGTAVDQILADDSNQVYAVAVDSTNVYFTSQEQTLRRVPINGGPGDFLFPQGDNNQFPGLDDTHFFAPQSSGNDAGGFALGAPKTNAGDRTRYDSPQNIGTAAIASDGVNVFIANDGNYDFQPVGNGSLITCPIAGCPDGGGTALMNNLRATGPIILDDAIYFLEYGGSAGNNGRLLKMAKP